MIRCRPVNARDWLVRGACGWRSLVPDGLVAAHAFAMVRFNLVPERFQLRPHEVLQVRLHGQGVGLL